MAPSGIGKVVHVTPGRLRLRLDRSERTAAVYDEIRGLLGALPGVTTVDITAPTGSVLVIYDPDTLDVASLLRLGGELGWIAPEGRAATAPAGDWRSYMDVPRAMRAMTVIGVAGLGALAGPALGVGARVGSVTASVGYLVLSRWAESARRGNRATQ